MPLYDLKCNSCGFEFETLCRIASYPTCPRCSANVRLLIKRVRTKLFPAGWWNDIGPEPIYISSRSQLKKECDKHGVYAKYLDPPITFKPRGQVN